MHSERVHANKQGILDVPVNRILTRRIQSNESTWKCTETNCSEPVTHFCNSKGTESLRCRAHANEFTARHELTDDSLWFSRELQKEKKSDSPLHYILVWDIPIQGRPRFGGLEWLWYPSTDGMKNVYRIFKERVLHASPLPLNVRWEAITLEEANRLLGQVLYERRCNFIPHIIGFASDHPFERPDLTLAYSLRRVGRSHHEREAYFFTYEKQCAMEKMQQSWQADVITFHPENGGQCNAGNFVRARQDLMM